MNIFSQTLGFKPKKSAFNLSHEWKSTAKFGELVPCLCREVLPADKWKLHTESFTRFAPMLAPLMHRINTFQHYFFVPNRIIFPQWEEFISPQGVPDEERPMMPSLHFNGLRNGIDPGSFDEELELFFLSAGSLCDYIGINIQNVYYGDTSTSALLRSDLKFSLLPFLAYQHIWLEYYADENIYDIRGIKKRLIEYAKHGEWKTTDFTSYEQWAQFCDDVFAVRFRAFEKDYFTSALPDTQRGAEVSLGLYSGESVSGTLHIPSVDVEVDVARKANGQSMTDKDGIAITNGYPVGYDVGFTLNDDGQSVRPVLQKNNQEALKFEGQTKPTDVEITDEFQVNPVTINELRRAVKLQEFLEKSMRGGYRLIEQIKAHFGVISSDARLDRPQFLGGDMQKVMISEVTSSSATNDAILGEYSGHGTEVGKTKRRSFFSEEHGFIFCLFSCIPRTAYCQGIERQFTRFDWLDFAWPEFAHLGEQPVYNGELYTVFDQNKNEEIFGYQSRYADYKTIPSSIHGSFKKDLDYWTLTRIFSGSRYPRFSSEFVSVMPDDGSLTRAFTVTQSESDYLFINLYHQITAVRPLPKFGVPML